MRIPPVFGSFGVVIVLLMGVYVFAPTATASAEDPTALTASDGAPTVLAVRMYADWCGYCQALDEKLDNEVRAALVDEPVVFLYFDMTDEQTQTHARRYAAHLGLAELFDEHQGQTGYMVLVDAETGEAFDRITSEASPDAIRETLTNAASTR